MPCPQLLALDLCSLPVTLSSVAMGLQLPDEYGYVVLAHCMSWISNFYLTFNVAWVSVSIIESSYQWGKDGKSGSANASMIHVYRAQLNLTRWGRESSTTSSTLLYTHQTLTQMPRSSTVFSNLGWNQWVRYVASYFLSMWIEGNPSKPPSSSALLHSARFIWRIPVAVMVDDGSSV